MDDFEAEFADELEALQELDIIGFSTVVHIIAHE